jgi:hypothetical protein
VEGCRRCRGRVGDVLRELLARARVWGDVDPHWQIFKKKSEFFFEHYGCCRRFFFGA